MLASIEMTSSMPFIGVGLMVLGTCLGCGLIAIGAAKGIGIIASRTVESIARQPEAGGRIFTSMIISAAMIEGFTFFAIIVCLLGLSKINALVELVDKLAKLQ